MSLEQGSVTKNEHGGAHVSTHGTIIAGAIGLPSGFVSAETLNIDNKSNEADKTVHQDGGQKVGETEESGIGLPFLPELGTDCLDSYDTAVVENNTEWLKARCKNFGQIEFDMAPQSNNDDTLDFPGIPLDNSKVILQTDCSTSSLADRLAASADIVSTEPSKPRTVTIVSKSLSHGAQYATPYLTLSGTNIAETDINFTQPAVSMQTIIPSSLIHKKKSLIDHTELCTDDSDVSLVKSSVGKTGGTIYQTIEDQTIVNVDQLQNANPVVINGVTSPEQDTTEINIPSVSPAVVNDDNMSVISDDLKLTTISIATDVSNNSTKILVDSSQGQQLYHLNISDLTKLQNGTMLKIDGNSISENGAAGVPTAPNYILLTNGNEDSQTLENGTQIVAEASKSDVPSNAPKGSMYMCMFEGCQKMFKNLAKLEVHSMTHTGQRPFKCTEPGCDWAFTKAYKLTRHMESHRGTKEYQCEECNKKFTTIYNLKTHMKTHSRPCTEQCPVEGCNLKFQTRRELDRHLRTHDGVEKTYRCPHEGCNKVFLSPYCVGSHPRVHQQEAQDLTCQFEGCGRKFDKLCRLRQHQRVHTGEKPYVCHFNGCDWAFSTASKLTRHMTKHTNQRKWVCNECGKAFMRSEHLKGHLITHTGIKPFICPVEDCGQKFVSKSSVYVHLRKHELAERRKAGGDLSPKSMTYHCPMESCNLRYTSKAKLRAHIVKHFPGTMKPEDAAQIDIVPLIEGPGSKVEPSAVTVKTSQDGSIMTVDPVEFISTTVDSSTGESSSSVHNQFTAELTAELCNIATPVDKKVRSTPIHTMPEEDSSLKSPRKTILGKRDNCEVAGSARTDFTRNEVLRDRVKKRRKHLRDKAAGISTDDSTSQAVVSSPDATDTSSPVGEDQLTSPGTHGITFRDPETGVLYVQMQLLQDDPPHPDLYSNDPSLPSSLDLPTVITDNNTQSHEFFGSTINLQDLG